MRDECPYFKQWARAISAACWRVIPANGMAPPISLPATVVPMQPDSANVAGNPSNKAARRRFMVALSLPPRGIGRLWRDEVSEGQNLGEKEEGLRCQQQFGGKQNYVACVPVWVSRSLYGARWICQSIRHPAESPLRITQCNRPKQIRPQENKSIRPDRVSLAAFLTRLLPDSATDRPTRSSRCYPDRSRRSESFWYWRVGLPRVRRRLPGSRAL